MWAVLLLLGGACSGTVLSADAGLEVDAGASSVDAGVDAGVSDAGGADAGVADAGVLDAGTPWLVAVGYGARRVSSPDGQAWSHLQELDANGGDDDNLFRGVCFGGGVFVAVGGSTRGFSMTSTDGVTWAHENRLPSAWVGNCAWLDGQFIAAGGNGLRMRSTDLGQTWRDEAGYEGVHYRDVVAGQGLVVAVGHTYAGVGTISTTSDGVTWTSRVSSGAAFGSVAYGHGVFVARGDASRVAWSADGLTWQDVTVSGATPGAGSLVFTGAEFLTGLGGSTWRSTDGATWSATTIARSVDAFGLGQAFSLGWPASIAVSGDLATWSTVFSAQGSGLTRLVEGRL